MKKVAISGALANCQSSCLVRALPRKRMCCLGAEDYPIKGSSAMIFGDADALVEIIAHCRARVGKNGVVVCDPTFRDVQVHRLSNLVLRSSCLT